MKKWEAIDTTKLGGKWFQQFAIVRKNTVYLRITGNGTTYRLMTATASEDHHRYCVCHDQERLIKAAAALAKRYNISANIHHDQQGRAYCAPFIFTQKDGLTDKDFTSEVHKVIDDFFAIYDSTNSLQLP